MVWSPTTSPTTSLPTTLGSARVRIDGKYAHISYAAAGQLNVLTPPDISEGTVNVEVTTDDGTGTATTTAAPTAPSWFSYTVGNATWAAALFDITAVYVAPAGSLGGIISRSTKAGDILQLYGGRLGPTNSAPPVGVVFGGAYPIADLSRITVTIGGKPATVQFAGIVTSGLYQVNVQAPKGIAPGSRRL